MAALLVDDEQDLGLKSISSLRASSRVHRPDVRSFRSPLLLLAQQLCERRPTPLGQASPSEPSLGPPSSVACSPRAACSAITWITSKSVFVASSDATSVVLSTPNTASRLFALRLRPKAHAVRRHHSDHRSAAFFYLHVSMATGIGSPALRPASVSSSASCANPVVRLEDTGTNMAHLPIAVHKVDHWHLQVTSVDFQPRLNSVAGRPKSSLVVALCRRAAVPLDHEHWGRRPGDPQGD